MSPISVWRFEHAPPELRDLSLHGGDEDWLAVVPAEMLITIDGEKHMPWIPWLESHGPFGCAGVTEHEGPDGSRVYIGAHA